MSKSPSTGAWLDKRGVILPRLCLALLAGSCLASPQSPASARLTLLPSDRILILAPHPDDEVLGCGGVIQQSLAMKLPVHIVYFTYGDNNEWSFLVYRKRPVLLPAAVKSMGLIRHDEAVAAAATLGIPEPQLTFLGYPDFGTLQIWLNHWGAAPPYESMLTRVTAVPYANALRPGAPYRGQEILRDLTTVFRNFKPTKIFVSHPADFNVDHRALYCFTQLALWDLESEMQPGLFPYLVHFPQWPAPRGLHPASPLAPPPFFANEISWQAFAVPPELITGKQKALAAHRTQFEYGHHYLASFLRTNELFGDFPRLVFTPGTHANLAPGGGTRHYAGDEEDQLTEAERNGFVGLEWRHLQISSNTVTISIDLSRPLAEAVSATIQVFGYRRDTPFATLPKIQVNIDALHYSVHNQSRRLSGKTVRILHRLNEIEAEIPLDLLGQPERLWVCARTYLGAIPLDWVSWRIVEVR